MAARTAVVVHKRLGAGVFEPAALTPTRRAGLRRRHGRTVRYGRASRLCTRLNSHLLLRLYRHVSRGLVLVRFRTVQIWPHPVQRTVHTGSSWLVDSTTRLRWLQFSQGRRGMGHRYSAVARPGVGGKSEEIVSLAHRLARRVEQARERGINVEPTTSLVGIRVPRYGCLGAEVALPHQPSLITRFARSFGWASHSQAKAVRRSCERSERLAKVDHPAQSEVCNRSQAAA